MIELSIDIMFFKVVQVGPDCGKGFSVGERVCCENHFYCGSCYQCLHGKIRNH